MENQQNIILMGHLYGVTVDIEGVSELADFEVIEIEDDSNPYHKLLGIYWDFDMDAVINLKKWKMTFEKKSLRVLVPLDPAEGARYAKPIHDFLEDDDDLDHIKFRVWNEDWIKPTDDGKITWDRDSSYTLNSDEELEHWQNQLHEVSTLRCNIMTKSLQCVLTKSRKLLHYDALTDVDLFLDEF